MSLLDPPAKPALPRPNTIVWLGDSITANGGRQTVSPYYNSNGFWCWGQFFMGHRLQTLNNAGVAGERSDQMLARITTDVLAYSPGWCHVLAGTNDVGQAVAMSTIKTNLAAIWSRLDAAGIRVIAGTIPPRSTYTGTMQSDTHELNAWIRAQGRARTNLTVVDYYAAVTDPSNGNYISSSTAGGGGQGVSPDGIHPGNAGAPRMGKALAATLTPLLPANPSGPSSEGDLVNALLYSRFTAGTVGSATPPTGWLESGVTGGPVVYSRTSRATADPGGVPGQWLTMTVPNGCHGTLVNSNLRGSSWAVGDIVVGALEIQRTGINASAALSTSGVSLQVVALGPNTALGDLAWTYGSSDNQPFWDHAGIMRTPPLTIPANTTGLKLQMSFGEGQTINLDRAGILNLTKWSLAA